MEFSFTKYQGTGNDFVVIDDRKRLFDSTNEKYIRFLCDRRKGVGADGLILLRNHVAADFEMLYFNADGKQGTMCGNGGRCIVDFAKHLGMVNEYCRFIAVDGLHEAKWTAEKVALKMLDVAEIKSHKDYVYLDTGSPHHIQFVNDLDNFPVYKTGKSICFSDLYKQEGVNVNFVELINTRCRVRTYERGVEDETLSCGTGVTAVVIALHYNNKIDANNLTVETRGGKLEVSFDFFEKTYHNIWLTGKIEKVFKGEIVC